MTENTTVPDGSHTLLDKKSLPIQLLWLADSPLFIDARRVESFYDAVVRPYMRQRTIVSESSTTKTIDLLAELGVSGEVDSGQLIKMLAGWLPQLKISAEGKVSGAGNIEKSSGETTTWEVIETPQRQLEQLCLHYAVFQRDRMKVSTLSSREEWGNQKWISEVPRGLVLLDLPAGTKVLPTFAEFAEEGPQQLAGDNVIESGETVSADEEKTDWSAMFKGFDSQQCIRKIEKAGKSRIDAIDYRVRFDDVHEEPLHLHLEPMGDFTTLTFAYSMVKRAQKHGLRLVGTMRSGPSMYVLAAYEC